MKNELQTFNNDQFGTIRTLVNENGETYFVGKDVALALGYMNPQKALRDHVDAEDRTVNESFTVNGTSPIIINESGLYSLILSSQLPTAKAFKRWVTSEVLPQIRRTGGYIPTKDSRTGERLSDEQIVRAAESIMQRTISDENAPADGCLSSTALAKQLGLQLSDFFLLVEAAGIVCTKAGRHRLSKDYEDKGLAESRYFHYFTLNGKKRQRPYLAWTAEGVEFITGLLRASTGSATSSQ